MRASARGDVEQRARKLCERFTGIEGNHGVYDPGCFCWTFADLIRAERRLAVRLLRSERVIGSGKTRYGDVWNAALERAVTLLTGRRGRGKGK